VRVVVCATSGASVEALREVVHDAGAWETVPVVWPNAKSLLESRATAAALLVFAEAGNPVCESLLALVASRPDRTPLIVIGALPPASGNASAWFPEVPPAPLLAAALEHVTGASEQRKPTWRRKADMIIGSSPAIRELVRSLDHLAPASTPVIITGESGVGKELVARSLHYCGPRAAGSFIALNCAAIPDTLFESELFGHERGAFTGAVGARAGAFEAAHDGTLFLDEIGDLPLALQAKLLRVLETGEVVRLGSTESHKVNFRLVSATNRALEADVASGRFRQDLYYRIQVYPLVVPPLRDRPEDIPALAVHHLAIISKREKIKLRLTADAVEKLISHSWPGNVRDLVNTLERAALLAEDGTIDGEHVLLSGATATRATTTGLVPFRKAKQQFETQYYSQLLRAAAGNISLAAKLAQKTRKEIYDALKRLELERADLID
jgi:transcriptional regulator with GAF, ATPase, and Fis domain